jgi:hypothetical protein
VVRDWLVGYTRHRLRRASRYDGEVTQQERNGSSPSRDGKATPSSRTVRSTLIRLTAQRPGWRTECLLPLMHPEMACTIDSVKAVRLSQEHGETSIHSLPICGVLTIPRRSQQAYEIRSVPCSWVPPWHLVFARMRFIISSDSTT